VPSKSEAQRRLMAAAAKDPALAKRVGVPRTVAREYSMADARVSKVAEMIGRLSTGKPVIRNSDGSVSTHRNTGERIRVYESEAAARTDYELRQHRQVDREASWVQREYEMGKKKR
jgi:hypothetical protein